MFKSIKPTQGQTQTSVDFLIITALREERDAVLRHLGDYKKIQTDGSPTYYKTSVFAYSLNSDYEIAVTMLSQMGNIEAAHHAAQAIRDLNPTYVLMIGIAAGIKGQVNLGDVIVGTQLLYYEQVKQKPDGTDQRPQIYPADPMLLDRALNYTDISWFQLMTVERPDNPENAMSPKVHFGPIAVGEKIVANQPFVNNLKKLHSKLIGIEMESFGVALATAKAIERPRFLTIRGICDYADPEKNDNWHEYAVDSAAAFTVSFLRSGPVLSHSLPLNKIRQDTSLITIRQQSMEPIAPHAVSTSLPSELTGLEIIELLIDQTEFYVNGRLIDPIRAAQRQIDLPQRLTKLLDIHHNAKIAYYGIAHIPLLFLAGYQLSTKQQIYLFEHNRRTDYWDQLQIGGHYPEIKIDGMPASLDLIKGEVVIRISISYPVTLEAIAGIVPEPIASLHFSVNQPGLDIVTSQDQLKQYSNSFREMLDEIHHKLPNTERIHLFYAGPATLAFNFGRLISKTIHPRIVIYNYFSKDSPRYAWGLEITSDIESTNFFIKTRVK